MVFVYCFFKEGALRKSKSIQVFWTMEWMLIGWLLVAAVLWEKVHVSGTGLPWTMIVSGLGTKLLGRIGNQSGSSTFQILFWGTFEEGVVVFSKYWMFVCFCGLSERFLRTGFHFHSIYVWITGNTIVEWGKLKASLLAQLPRKKIMMLVSDIQQWIYNAD